MSQRVSLFMVLVGGLLGVQGAFATSADATLAEPIPIADVLEMEPGWAAVEGRVVGRNDKIFELEDATGRMLVLIPEHLTRKQGMPGRGERVRVQGRFGHKQLDERTRGIRADALERNRPEPDRAAVPSPRVASQPAAAAASDPLPAAPAPRRAGFQASPNLSTEMVDRLGAAADGVRAAREELTAADAAYAAVLASGEAGVHLDEAQSRMNAAEAALREALGGVPELVDAAREAGVSAGVIGLYEEEVYGP